MIIKRLHRDKEKKIVIPRWFGALVLAVCVMGVCTGCSKGKGLVTPQGGVSYYSPEKDTETETKISATGSKLYMILSMNSAEESMILYSYSNGLQYQYHYGLDTEFLDKYGTRSSVARFQAGKVVSVGKVSSSGVVSAVQISDEVWQYDDITRFSVDTSHKALKIADSNYSYNDETVIFSNDQVATIDDITTTDTLSVVGVNKRILSVTVTTGHGTLALHNTELFDGSYLQLDKKVFAEITPDLTMELPEGNYTLTVANDGWGGSQDITITRGETTQIDLDALKGEGPKSGKILFTVDALNAIVKVDGVQIDYLNPIELKYGKHSIEVNAEGYDTWKRSLYVNSPEATIIIELATETETKDTGTTTGSGNSSSGTTSGTNGTTNGTTGGTTSSSGLSGSGTTTNETSSSETKSDLDKIDSDYLKDYLSTLSDTLTSLTK